MLWKNVVVVLALTMALTTGCKQQCFLRECDYDHYATLMPPGAECNPEASLVPAGADIPQPPTVLHPERKIRYISLAECLAIALEHGTPGSQFLNGTTNFSLVSFGGVLQPPEQNIRILALQPAIVGSTIDVSLSKFDARWITSMAWSATDEPTGGNIFTSLRNGNAAQFGSALVKPLPTGGVVGITFNDSYTMLTQPPQGFLNPTYQPKVTFGFDQPLLQGFGVEINEIRNTHPGNTPPGVPGVTNAISNLPTIPSAVTGNQGQLPEGILITRIRFDEQRAEFERQIHVLLLNVEFAYWNLFGSYYSLYTREQALRQAFEAWKINKARFEAGRISIQDFAQTRAQFELFRQQRIDALGGTAQNSGGGPNQGVLENEAQLRGLLGLPLSDGCRLVPSDTPILAPYQPDWCSAVNEALALRPELVIARHDLKATQFNVLNQKNLLLPDLRLTSSYNINGLGSKMDGGSSSDKNALASLASDKFNDWNVGVNLHIPLGYRAAHAGLRAARLQLAQSYELLHDQEYRALEYLAQQYRFLFNTYEDIRAYRAQREANATQLEARFKEFQAGRGTLDILLEAQRNWADALRNEFFAIVFYQQTLATFEFAKGTIMQHDNVYIGEGPLPKCAMVRAADHEQERTKALVLRERAQPVPHPVCNCEGGTLMGAPELPPSSAASLPALFEGRPPMPEMPEHLPAPRPLDQARPKDTTKAPATPLSELSATKTSSPASGTASQGITELPASDPTAGVPGTITLEPAKAPLGGKSPAEPTGAR